TSYKLLGKKIQFLLPKFVNIENNLMKAAMPVPYAAYLASMVLISMIAGILGMTIGIVIPLLINLRPIELDFVIPFAVGITSFQLTFFIMHKYPNIQASSRKRKISEELPYFMGYMATLASSGLTLEGIFKAVAHDDTKEEIVNDAKYLVRNIDLLGMDIISAIRDLIKRSPLDPYSELLEGLIATVQSGGDLKEYFIATANVQLEEKKLLLRKMTESLGMLAEMYTILLIVFPLMAVIMLSIMAIMTPTLGGLSLPTLMNLLTYGFVPIFGMMMLIMIDSMVPKR
ncbi:MAG: type II secretion system F family protein, partial [Patescibacteria group bacterium]|nr:type II secretion system F family protein [Patescibacteria group bacterium]